MQITDNEQQLTTDELRTSLKSFVDAQSSVSAAAKMLNVTVESICRVIGGLTVRKGTEALLRQGLKAKVGE